jgi:hypothetical protein
MFIAELKPPPSMSVKKTRDGQPSWRDWQGFITRLRGTSGLLRVVDYYRQRPAYDEAIPGAPSQWSNGSLWNDGASWTQGALPPFLTLAEPVRANEDSIVVQGLPANTDEVLRPADPIELRPDGVATPYGNYYEVVHCARSNADGKARVYIQPPARENFAAGDMAVVREASCVFRLSDSDQGIVTRSMGNVGNLGFKLIEELKSA